MKEWRKRWLRPCFWRWFRKERLHFYVLAVVAVISATGLVLTTNRLASVAGDAGLIPALSFGFITVENPFHVIIPLLLFVGLLPPILWVLERRRERVLMIAMMLICLGMTLTLAVAGYVQLSCISGQLVSTTTTGAQNFLAHTQNLLNFFSALLTVAAIGATVFGFWIQARLDKLGELDKRIAEVSKLAVVAAESALIHLPPTSQSQQVSDKAMAMLSVMNRLIFEDTDRTFLDYLNNQKNGARLRLAKAVYEYGRGNFSIALHHVTKAQEQGTDVDLQLEAIWLQATLLRQMGEVAESRKAFAEVDREGERRDRNDLRTLAIVGFALCDLAKEGVNHSATINNMRALGADQSETPPMLQMYYVKLHLRSGPGSLNATSLNSLRDACHHLLTWLIGSISRTDSLNLKANYAQSLAYVYWVYSEVGVREHVGSAEQKADYRARAVNHLAHSVEWAKRYEDEFGPDAWIYAELKETLMPADSFVKEAEQMKNTFELISEGNAEKLTQYLKVCFPRVQTLSQDMCALRKAVEQALALGAASAAVPTSATTQH